MGLEEARSICFRRAGGWEFCMESVTLAVSLGDPQEVYRDIGRQGARLEEAWV